MKGYISFCPHFHQPHFQLYKTREEAYQNSYLPWLRLLQDAVKLESFYINLHFSGPFLYWIKDRKPEYTDQLKELIASNKIGIIGGLADEPFIQLSSRNDDCLYQLKKYDELVCELTGISARQWQGIHIVERECGEVLLQQLTYAANLMKTPPVFYLDAETFYQSHFAYPGSDSDYCLKHFGFIDPVSKTTISHIPQEMLYFALRDEINGQAYYSLPVHSQFRYQLLKRHSFTPEDTARIKPKHYYFYIKEALENAYEMVKEYGRDIEPIVVIFEDAEKFGQWSKDPDGDGQWMLEFFKLVEKDKDIQFIGLNDYIKKHGFLDTYPASTSHSYPEWENWTAKRGIRGVIFGDERLRRVICRLRDIEDLQEKFELMVLRSFQEKFECAVPDTYRKIIERAVTQSAERFDLVKGILEDMYPGEMGRLYENINRIRNVVYQEDPKWASRHPSYGSSPYYDIQGVAYLEMAEKVLKELINTVGSVDFPTVEKRDWDFDNQDEVLIINEEQTVIIDTCGGCISYHHVLSPAIAGNIQQIAGIISADMDTIRAYNAIYRYAYPLVFTEADSSMTSKSYHEGGRQEVCRNSLRCEIFMTSGKSTYKCIGSLDIEKFIIDSISSSDKDITVEMSCNIKVKNEDIPEVVFRVKKSFRIEKGGICFTVTAEADRELQGMELFLAPQLVTSAAPSDEREFKPRAFIGVNESIETEIEYWVREVSAAAEEGFEYYDLSKNCKSPKSIDYIYGIQSGDGSSFNNLLRYEIDSPYTIQQLRVQPAVNYYYKDYVYDTQSRLGYHTSGTSIIPIVSFSNNKASFEVRISWEFDTSKTEDDYEKVFDLIKAE